MIAAFAILIISVIASQYIMIGAIKQLSDGDKVKLMSGKQLNRAQIRSVIMIAIAVAYYFAVTSFPDYAYYLLTGFIIFLVAERIYTFINAQQRLLAMELPVFYVNRFVTASIISSTGLVLFFILLLHDLF